VRQQSSHGKIQPFCASAGLAPVVQALPLLRGEEAATRGKTPHRGTRAPGFPLCFP
jgi:hypothetical protein